MDIVDLLRKEGYFVVEGAENTRKLINVAKKDKKNGR